jgi:anti-anti-sigma factor
MSEFEIRARTEEGIPVAELHGELTAEDAKEAEKRLTELLKEGNYRLILEASDLRYVNSGAMMMLVGIAAAAAENGGRIVTLNPSLFFTQSLEILGLIEQFCPAEDLASALATVKE